MYRETLTFIMAKANQVFEIEQHLNNQVQNFNSNSELLSQ